MNSCSNGIQQKNIGENTKLFMNVDEFLYFDTRLPGRINVEYLSSKSRVGNMVNICLSFSHKNLLLHFSLTLLFLEGVRKE